MPARDSAARGALPIGLAHRVKLKRDIAQGATVGWDDVDCDAASQAVRVRRDMERVFGEQPAAVPA
jgi:predicted homoserine dehydrogenase-like protein